MADLVFSCPSDNASYNLVSGALVPACTDGVGQWVDEPQPWWGYQMPAGDIGALLSAQMLFFAVVLVARMVDKSIS